MNSIVFNSLMDSAESDQLLLVDNGICQWFRRQDGQITIRVLISTRPGTGQLILKHLRTKLDGKSLFASVPVELDEANRWFMKQGFVLEQETHTYAGKPVNHWRLML
jgi:hypothetical protein